MDVARRRLRANRARRRCLNRVARLATLPLRDILSDRAPAEAARAAVRWPAADLSGDALRRDYPDAVRALLVRADDAVGGRLRLFGRLVALRGVDGRFDWRFDPRGPELASFQGDPKFPWEVARHAVLPLLGAAWRLTGEARYAELAAGVVHDWARAEPVRAGLHYDSALEVGVRLVAWCQAFQLLRDAPAFDNETFGVFFRHLAMEAAWLEGHLSDERLVAGNHLLGELAGLLAVDLTFPELAAAEARAHGGYRRLDYHLPLYVREMERQVFPDGVSREQSTTYGRFVADFAATVLVAARAAAVRVDPALPARGAALARWLLSATQPDGTLPLVGDNDNGRGADWGEDLPSNDARGVARTLAVLAADARPLSGDSADDADFGVAFWLGSEGLATLGTLRARATARPALIHFPDGGHAALRGTEGDFAYVRCGPFGHGLPKPCAHSHADFMAPVVWLGGAPLLVDPGNFGYTTVGLERAAFQSNAAHSVFQLDGVPLGTPHDAFRWEGIPPAGCLEVVGAGGAGGELRLVGRFSPAGPAGKAVVLIRAVVYTLGQRVMHFEDRWEAPEVPSTRTAVWRWRFPAETIVAPAVDAAGPRRSWRIRRPGAAPVEFHFEAPPGEGPLETRLLDGEVAPCYARRRRAPILEITWRGRRTPDAGFRSHFILAP